MNGLRTSIGWGHWRSTKRGGSGYDGVFGGCSPFTPDETCTPSDESYGWHPPHGIIISHLVFERLLLGISVYIKTVLALVATMLLLVLLFSSVSLIGRSLCVRELCVSVCTPACVVFAV